MSNASKLIPVTKERLKELNELKQAGETFDDLLGKLIQNHHRSRLVERTKTVRESDSEDLTSLGEL